MHRSLPITTSVKKTPSWKLIGVVFGVVMFIMFVSYYQLNRTLEAIRVHNNHDADPEQHGNNKVGNNHEVKASEDERNDDHNAALSLLADVIDVKNGNPDLVKHNREQSNNNNKKMTSLSESDTMSNMMKANSKNGNDAVKSICPRLAESLEKFDVNTSRESDLFLTTSSKPISELIPASVDEQELDKISKLDVELFVIWYDAISKTHKILNDMRKKFFIVGIEYVDWNHDRVSGHDFESNLWRLYSGKGGWERVGMPKKVKQCGYGPFIIVAVVDPTPSYKVEHTAHGDDTVNHNMNAAKKLYRGWAGGGFKVHGTFGPVEAEHDIALLFHRSKYDFGYVFKHLLELQRQDVDKKRSAKFVLLVDEFVKNLRSIIFNSGGSKSINKKNGGGAGGGNGEIVPFNFRFDHPLSISTNNREVSSRFVGESTCRLSHQQQKNESSSSLRLLLGDSLKPDPALATKYRDFVFSNEYVTARQTLGVHGFYACRDLLLALKTFIDARQIQDVEGFSQESDQQQVTLKDLECLSCAKWPTELKIKLSGESGEAARWAISSLVATSAEESIYATDKNNEKMKRPNGFKDVPFFVLGSGKKAKKITFKIV